MRALVLALTLLAAPAWAQDSRLADIRAELAALYGQIDGLRGELTATGVGNEGIAGATPLDRLAAIEAELNRLTSKTEELEFRINRITTDGTNRIGDLEFRVCELDPGCDINQLGDTPSLGGVDSAAEVPVAADPQTADGPQLAVGEDSDFRAAEALVAAGDFQAGSDRLATFIATYPGSPLTSQALFLRGQALEGLGQVSDAARTYLDSFSGEPSGPRAAQALLRLGVLLGQLGQVPDACVTLGEVRNRFAADPAAGEAATAMAALACP